MVAMSRRGQRLRAAALENPISMIAVVAMLVVVATVMHSQSLSAPGGIAVGSGGGGAGGAGAVGTGSDLNSLSVLSTSLDNPTTPITDIRENAAQIKAWRKEGREKCQAAKTADDVRQLGRASCEKTFVRPFSPTAHPREGPEAVMRCKRVVMDFGANIGDTSGKVIDAGLHGCDRSKDLKANAVPPTLNVETKAFEEPKRRNPLVTQFVKLMQGFKGEDLGPEDYCYYGVEGNPVFTTRLQKLEDFIMDIRPRPLRHVHFFTESVGAGEDGMTKLYLDTVNANKNFWGSSIFENHQDVRKSSANSTTKIAADVMGYTIGTLMRKTMSAFDPEASEEDKTGGHLILKVDIEGGEYPLLNQAAEDGTLCEFVKMGNHADLYIEYHSQKVTGKHSLAKKKGEIQKKLSDCGVNFRGLQAWWA